VTLAAQSDKHNARIAIDAFARCLAIGQAGLADAYERAEAAGDFDTCERLAAQVGCPFDGPLPGKEPLFASVDLSDIEGASYDAPDYVVQSLLPRGHVTLLGGHGGSGKSMLALTLAAHVAAGRDWCSLYTAKLRSVFVSLEDRGELVRYRLRKIVESYGLNATEVIGGLTILDGTDCPVLASELVTYGERSLAKTAAMLELADAVKGAGLVIIDNASDAFDGQENDRRQVRAFVRMLAEIARENDAAVCLLAHIDKAAARYGSAGNSYSGSTAWHNSARSRLALLSDEGSIELRQEKLNLGKASDPIALEWNDRGVLKPIHFSARAATDELTILAAIREAISAGVTVNTAHASAFSSAKCLEPYLPPEFANAKGGKRVNRALASLQASGHIRRDRYRSDNRKDRERWVLAHPAGGEPL
jgi:KaiC/GvpD/RAD55 family RecA-like ATPase